MVICCSATTTALNTTFLSMLVIIMQAGVVYAQIYLKEVRIFFDR